jgi:hypothetical protein
MSSIYVIDLFVPWFAPETAGKLLPEELGVAPAIVT